ncbi:solute carrier family 23 protein [Bacillus sp. AFS041924]|uniref:solute carrier family 23 protein n=1 Tax=Bacillus sp. AFS041924 TaxID=2033503 RepID=UPI000BFE3F9D|nr:solute carrier family 23 protein [Bacillus sp. AFS041924]PGS53679.1 uracil permease [Bacillus sp. AFS041924]
MLKQKPVLEINEKPNLGQWFFLSLQHLFAMFGATVLAPILIGINPSIALISSGIGTIVFVLITRGKVPSYLGSSFAFIAPMIYAKTNLEPGAAFVGVFITGIIYAIISLIINKVGVKWLFKVLPPIVVGPVIIVIGLSLSSVAVGMAMNGADGKYSSTSITIALITLAITIITALFTKGFLSVIPILVGIIGGYITSIFFGVVDFTGIAKAHWLAVPDFSVPFVNYTPHVTLQLLIIFVPVAIVTISEHIGHQVVLGNVVNKDLIKDPGLDKSLFGDAVSTMIAGLIGGPTTTTYGENIGVLAITRAYSVYLFIGAAIFAMVFGFIGKISAVISSIPTPVMGGISILLFGIIASSGLRVLVENKTDFSKQRNLIIASVILVLGIGGAAIHIGKTFALEGMALSALIGVVLNLVLPEKIGGDRMIENDKEENSLAS